MSLARVYRLPNLDLLRLLAVLLVLGRHMAVPSVIPDWPAWVQRTLATWERGGWVGVDLFFVLSGFLVSGLLFSEYRATGHISVGRFYFRRGLKIYPAFYVLLAVSAVLLPAIGRPFTADRLLAEMLFVQNYWPSLWTHTWSLAVEEHFYLALPLLVWGLARFNRRAAAPLRPVVFIALGLVAALLVLRVLSARPAPTDFGAILYRSHFRLDSLMFGVAIAYAYHWHERRFTAVLEPAMPLLAIGGLACFVPAFVCPLGSSAFLHTAGLTLFQVGSGMLVIWALLARSVSHPVLRALANVGTYSYSIYLWHNAVILLLEPFIERHVVGQLSYPVRFAFTGLLAIGVGAALAKIIEMPVLSARDRWFPAPQKSGPSAATSLSVPRSRE